MALIEVLYLTKQNMGATVATNMVQPAEPCVTAIALLEFGFGWCLIADHPGNAGVSVTNGFKDYADAVSRSLKLSAIDIAWFELDSMGYFDQVNLLGEGPSFAPIQERGYDTRTIEAFFARATQHFGPLPPEYVEQVREQYRQFQSGTNPL